MTINAQIGFTQTTNVGSPGQALFGVTGQPVVIRNCLDTPDVSKWSFGLVSVPPGSGLALGDFQSGPTKTGSFNPDVVGGYLARLTVQDALNNSAIDYRVFQVKLASGRYIPPFNARGAALNFAGQGRGWSPVMEEWLSLLDIVGSVPFDIPFFTGDFTTQEPAGSPERLGGREIDLSPYPATLGGKTRVIRFLGTLQASAGTASLTLFDAANGVLVTNGSVSSSTPAYGQYASSPIPAGTASGNIRTDAAGGGFYEARLSLTGGGLSDVAVCTNARLRITYV